MSDSDREKIKAAPGDVIDILVSKAKRDANKKRRPLISAAAKKKSVEKRLKDDKARKKRLRANRIKAGVCVRCGDMKALPNRQMCLRCGVNAAELNRANWLRKRQERRLKDAEKKSGEQGQAGSGLGGPDQGPQEFVEGLRPGDRRRLPPIVGARAEGREDSGGDGQR